MDGSSSIGWEATYVHNLAVETGFLDSLLDADGDSPHATGRSDDIQMIYGVSLVSGL
jgi:hypothetical protein